MTYNRREQKWKGDLILSEFDAHCVTKAAEQEDANAQYMLGVMYAEGQGVSKDAAETFAQVMTDKQWEGILLMVRSIAKMCESTDQMVKLIDNILDGKKKTNVKKRKNSLFCSSYENHKTGEA